MACTPPYECSNRNDCYSCSCKCCPNCPSYTSAYFETSGISYYQYIFPEPFVPIHPNSVSTTISPPIPIGGKIEINNGCSFELNGFISVSGSGSTIFEAEVIPTKKDSSFNLSVDPGSPYLGIALVSANPGGIDPACDIPPNGSTNPNNSPQNRTVTFDGCNRWESDLNPGCFTEKSSFQVWFIPTEGLTQEFPGDAPNNPFTYLILVGETYQPVEYINNWSVPAFTEVLCSVSSDQNVDFAVNGTVVANSTGVGSGYYSFITQPGNSVVLTVTNNSGENADVTASWGFSMSTLVITNGFNQTKNLVSKCPDINRTWNLLKIKNKTSGIEKLYLNKKNIINKIKKFKKFR